MASCFRVMGRPSARGWMLAPPADRAGGGPSRSSSTWRVTGWSSRSSVRARMVVMCPRRWFRGKPGKSRAKLAKPINSRELIARIVASRRPILTPGVLLGLKDSPPIPSHEIADIRAAAVADSTLSIVGAVMLTAVAGRTFPQLLRQLTDFARSVCENAESARALSVGVSVFPPAEQADITELRNALMRFRELRDAGIKAL